MAVQRCYGPSDTEASTFQILRRSSSYSVTLASHLVRAFNDISLATFEITGPQMVLTMKLTTFAWNVYDGRRPLEVRRLTLHSLDLN